MRSGQAALYYPLPGSLNGRRPHLICSCIPRAHPEAWHRVGPCDLKEVTQLSFEGLWEDIPATTHPQLPRSHSLEFH